jgi:hypothetical protein
MIGADYDDDDDVRGGDSVAVRLATAAAVVYVKGTLLVALFTACTLFWVWLLANAARILRGIYEGNTE